MDTPLITTIQIWPAELNTLVGCMLKYTYSKHIPINRDSLWKADRDFIDAKFSSLHAVILHYDYEWVYVQPEESEKSFKWDDFVPEKYKEKWKAIGFSNLRDCANQELKRNLAQFKADLDRHANQPEKLEIVSSFMKSDEKMIHALESVAKHFFFG